ncbi:MAG: aldehyde dehydrogenase family protein, partial [Sphingomonadales bacterium]|nr:aldehyde dehydrogenase family protein [Sphingomonadales bacterium]
MKLENPKLFRQQAYINGEWADADNGKVMEITNPATGDVIGTVPLMGKAETLRAIDGANDAWDAWKKRTAKDRANVLRKFFDLILANMKDLATIMTTEQGKPMPEAMGDVVYAASFIEWFAEEGKRIYGDTIPQHMPDLRIVV